MSLPDLPPKMRTDFMNKDYGFHEQRRIRLETWMSEMMNDAACRDQHILWEFLGLQTIPPSSLLTPRNTGDSARGSARGSARDGTGSVDGASIVSSPMKRDEALLQVAGSSSSIAGDASSFGAPTAAARIPRYQVQIPTWEMNPRTPGEAHHDKFVVFRMNVTRTLPGQARSKSKLIRRRFREFVKLHEQLSAYTENHGLIGVSTLPPLPSKHFWLFTGGALERRRRDLEKYLNNLLRDPSFMCEELQDFLWNQSDSPRERFS